jgi:hypothetical protein
VPPTDPAPAAQRLTDRIGYEVPLTASAGEESLVVDDRSALTPAQMVESKLSRILEGSTVPVSHLQMRGLLRRR